jgi:Cytochrome c554 and c-prime
MDCYSTLLKIPRASVCNSLAVAVVAAALALVAAAIRPAVAEDNAPAASDQQCLGCHGSAGMEKRLEGGGILQLHVPADMFAKSVHSSIGCAGCHSDIDVAAHPPAEKDIPSARGFSIAMTQVCRGCHADKFDQWETSIHAALILSNNPAAPICTDCHNPHAVIKGAAISIDQIPCKKCHVAIYAAYLGSMHAKARLKSEQSYAPICTDCHSAHAVQPTSIGQGPEAACFGCHAGVLEAHEKWLPNAALHFEVVSCPACHAPDAQRKVDLMLIDSKDAQPRGIEQVGVPLFEASSHSGDKGIDAQALWKLLQTLNRSGIAGKTVLRGRLEASTGAQAHQLTDKNKAISDCRICHSAGSQAFQNVTISLVEPQGQRLRYGANADVLSSPISLESVGGFYAIGATRINLLDILLILAILGGLAVPVGHLTLGWIFKHYVLTHPQIGGGGGGHGGQPGNGQDHKAA